MAKTKKKTPAKKASHKGSARKKSAAGPRTPSTGTALAKPMPVITPLIGIGIDKGLLIAVMTQPDDADLTDFRMAIDRPYYKMLSAPASRCRASHAVVKDEKAGVDRKTYVAFIPAPAKAVIEGAIPCGAKVGKDPLFFSVQTEPLAKMDREKLRKILFVLHPQFEAVLPQVLPAKHPLLLELAPITASRRRQEKWQKIQAEVKRLLEAKQVKKALDLLVPLALTKQPMPEAEKLLGEMLWLAKRGHNGSANGAAHEEEEVPAEIKALRTEQLMFEFALSRVTQSKAAG